MEIPQEKKSKMPNSSWKEYDEKGQLINLQVKDQGIVAQHSVIAMSKKKTNYSYVPFSFSEVTLLTSASSRELDS